jgi:Kef-type K+ transport system membrane component KefB
LPGLNLINESLFDSQNEAVVVKILENNNKINSEMGRLTLEVLIVEYLAIVPMILTIKRIG